MAAGGTLFDAARNFAEGVEPLKAEFIRHGLPFDFIESLKSAAEDLQSAIAEQVDARGRRKASIQEFDRGAEEFLCASAVSFLRFGGRDG